MFSFRKKEPDVWRLSLGFSHEVEGDTPHRQELSWAGGESEAGVLGALHDALASPSLVHEHARVQLITAAPSQPPLLGVVAAAAFGRGARPVRLALTIQATRAALTEVELGRASGSAPLGTSLALELWSALEVGAVTKLRVADAGAVAALADTRVLARFASLRCLNLSHAGLSALPACIGLLTDLQELRVVGNALRILPPDIGKLTKLRVLAADSNQLTILPGELRQCTLLEELTLQHNRLTSVLLSFASLRNLSVLHLYDNPLEFLPEISPCTRLQHLTVANLRVTCDPAFRRFTVEVLPPPPGGSSSSLASISLWDSKQADKLRPIFSLMLRRSSGHHPLLAGALRVLAEEDPKNRELMARQENGLQQLVLMALSDSPVVVEETCRTLTLLAEHSPTLADAVVQNDAGAIMRLLPAADEARQLSSLRLLAAIAYSSPAASLRIATPQLLAALQHLVGADEGSQGSSSHSSSGRTAAAAAAGGAAGQAAGGAGRSGSAAAAPAEPGEEVRTAALKALGNLAFCPDNRRRLSRTPALMARLSALALRREGPPRLQVAALRVLAVLGENELVWRAVGRPPIQGRGVRILSMDGGGMKGMATVRLLRELERHTGKRIHELFDLVVGTSTGGLLAVALALRKMSLDECEHIYKVLGRRVFSRIVATKEAKEESWMESFYRTFRDKTSHVRAVVVGYKHDAAVYEALLREYCDFGSQEACIGDSMIDTVGLDTPAVALVSTLASVTPAPPFVFRSYQLPPGSEALADQLGAHGGSCKHPVWQAVRASSAASFYLEDFSCGGDKFQDGAVTANNPSVIALQEARLLWPDHPVDVMVSLGVGLAPATRREKGLSSFMETGSILIESSTDVLRAEEALATLLPLVPGVKYFRFRASDPRCAMELDEIDPERWAALEAATDDYIALPATQQQFADAAAALGKIDMVAAEQAAAPRLGTRRRLVVLRCPGMGSAWQAGLDDAVAASLSMLPACAAAVDLQSLAAPGVAAASGEEEEELLPSMASASATQPAPAAHQIPPQTLAAATGEEGGGSAHLSGSEQRLEHADAEAGSLSAYLSSWFSSPSKPSKTALPPAGLAAAVQAAGFGSMTPRQQGPAVLALAADSSSPATASPRWQGTPTAAAGATAGRVEEAPPGAASSAASSSDGLAELIAQLEERLAPLLPSVGVVHLGCPQAAGAFVLQWRQRLQVIAEPSLQATALLAEAGLDPSVTRLVDVFSRQPSLELPGARTVTALSSQTQWAEGGPLSSLLLSASSPGLVLPAHGVAALGWLLRGKLVVASAALSPDIVAALLFAGASGVICRTSSHTHGLSATVQRSLYCAFFDHLYDALLGGSRAPHALHMAEAGVPALAGSFTLHLPTS
ncbi:hypothetical protein ABPG75_006544 [Micractinium tetrahymenae]